jgi:photosystem II stability/assembly factor-like uncharacterized protein
VTGAISVLATSTADNTKTSKISLKVVTAPPSAAFEVVGPGGGDILSVAIDPIAPQKIYASAFQSGLYATSDGGLTWRNFGTNLPADPRLGAVLAVSAQTGTVYAGTPSGTFRTINGGQQWTALALLPPPSSNIAAAIAPDPLSDGVLYLTDTKNGVYRSTDAGHSWFAITLPTTCGGSITVDSAQPGKLYYGSCSGLFVSADNGGNWSLLSNSGINIGAIVQARSDPHRFYASVPGAFPLVNLYRSTDGGVTWTQILQGDQIGGLLIDPANADHVYALTWKAFTPSGTIAGLIRTIDGGQTWSQLGFPVVTPDYTHPYLGALGAGSLLPVSAVPQVFLAQTANHLWRVENGGSLWSESDQGLSGNFGTQMAVDPNDPSVVYLSANNGSGISKSSDGGKTWSNIFTASAEAIAVDPFDSHHVLAGFGLFDPLQISNSPLQVSHDGGATWFDAPFPPTQGLPPASIAFDKTTPGTVYLGFPWQNSKLGIAKSTDGGATWSFVNNGLTGIALIVESLAVDPLSPSTIIAGTDGGIYKSIDGGAHWVLKSSRDISFSVAFDSSHAGFVYASGQVLLRSTDHGETWISVNTGRSDLVSPLTVAIDPRAADTLFLIPFGGPAVGWSPDAGTTWFWLSDGIAGKALGGNLSVPAIATTTPEVLYIPSSTAGVLSLVLQH